MLLASLFAVGFAWSDDKFAKVQVRAEEKRAKMEEGEENAQEKTPLEKRWDDDERLVTKKMRKIDDPTKSARPVAPQSGQSAL